MEESRWIVRKIWWTVVSLDHHHHHYYVQPSQGYNISRLNVKRDGSGSVGGGVLDWSL